MGPIKLGNKVISKYMRNNWKPNLLHDNNVICLNVDNRVHRAHQFSKFELST